MTLAAALLLVATALYAGFQWTIRIVVYPQLASVPTEAFVPYEARHQKLVSYAVGPLFVADGAASITAFVVGPRLSAAVAVGCLLIVLVLTAVGAVPQHRRLSASFDAPAYRRLLTVDTARLAAALTAVGAALWYAL